MTVSKSKSDVEHMLVEHQELRGKVKALREYLEAPRPEPGDDHRCHAWASDLADHLYNLHERLHRHFRDEEETRIFEELESAFPRAAHTLEKLKGEHGQILTDMRAVLAATLSYADGKPVPNPHLRRWIATILTQLSRHENSETELMQRLYYEDLGTGD